MIYPTFMTQAPCQGFFPEILIFFGLVPKLRDGIDPPIVEV
jgi:hypothetical protein